jgi:diguanylate cyclase (GGDEF)-like protein
MKVSDLGHESSTCDERRLAHYGQHDPLTNLGNRMALSEHIAATLTRVNIACEPLAVLSIDLDRFKEVNDGFGHPVDDAYTLVAGP